MPRFLPLWFAVVVAFAASWFVPRAALADVPAGDKLVDDFEKELSPDWVTLKVTPQKGVETEVESRVLLTDDSRFVHAGRGALSYFYEVAPKVLRGLALQRELNLTGMKSMHFWAKSNVSTALLMSLDEKTGDSYQMPFYCQGGIWQEITLNLTDFEPGDANHNGGTRLHADQLKGVHVGDLATMLVNAMPGLAGPRVLWLDDISFSPREAPFTSGPAPGGGAPIYQVDNFASPVIRWSPIGFNVHGGKDAVQLFDVPLIIEPTGPNGAGALKCTYPRVQNRMHDLVRNLEKADLQGAQQLDLRLKTTVDGTFLVVLEEKTGARYEQMMSLQAAGGWKDINLPLDKFTLADDSKDEDGHLTTTQIKTLSVIDVMPLGSLANGANGEGANTLWVADVRFELKR